MSISLSLNDALHGVERELTTHLKHETRLDISTYLLPNKGSYSPLYLVSIKLININKVFTASFADINEAVFDLIKQYSEWLNSETAA